VPIGHAIARVAGGDIMGLPAAYSDFVRGSRMSRHHPPFVAVALAARREARSALRRIGATST